MKMGDFWTRARPIRRQVRTLENYGHEPDQYEGKDENGRLVDKSPTNKKTTMKIGDLRTRDRTIRRQG